MVQALGRVQELTPRCDPGHGKKSKVGKKAPARAAFCAGPPILEHRVERRGNLSSQAW